MVPRIQTEHFERYPPEARQLATSHLPPAELPLAFPPAVAGADYLRLEVSRRTKGVGSPICLSREKSPEQLRKTMASFEGLRLPAKLEHLDRFNARASFSEQLSAHLWASHQLDTFRAASLKYVTRINAAAQRESTSHTAPGDCGHRTRSRGTLSAVPKAPATRKLLFKC